MVPSPAEQSGGLEFEVADLLTMVVPVAVAVLLHHCIILLFLLLQKVR